MSRDAGGPVGGSPGAPRVLLDGRPLRGRLSGVGQYVWHLASALAARGDDVRLEVLVHGDPGTADPQLWPPGVPVRSTGPLPRKAFTALAAYAPAVPARVFGIRADLVHSTYFERLPHLPRSTAVVTTVHDVAFLRHPEVFSRVNLAASRRALRWQLERSAALLVPSRFTRDELVELCGVDPARVVVTPLGVTEQPRPGQRDGGGAPPDDDALLARERPFVLYLGNLEPRKNLGRLLDAWAGSDVRRTHDLVLAGTALPHAAQLRERLSAGADSVVPLGFVPAQTKHALLRRCTAFVYPSLYEGFGIPVLEAMAAGAPVVTSTAGALVELTAGAALTVPPHDAAALREALEQVVDDDALRERLRSAGLQRAAAHSWERTAELTAQVHARVLAGTAPAGGAVPDAVVLPETGPAAGSPAGHPADQPASGGPR